MTINQAFLVFLLVAFGWGLRTIFDIWMEYRRAKAKASKEST
jgi:hypothetical protein